MRDLVLFTNVYNEADLLLPFWLDHHKKLDFDHLAVVMYESNDGSREMILDKWPDATILDLPSGTLFGAIDNDNRMMGLETCIDNIYKGCWKIALNTTEFLFHPNIKSYLNKFEEDYPNAMAIGGRSFVMVDKKELKDAPVIPNAPLFLQRHHGYIDKTDATRRFRYFHRALHGHYEVGRHGTSLPHIIDRNLLILWYGFSPFTQGLKRKLQIQTMIPEEDKRMKLGIQHLQTAETLLQEYLEFESKSINLLDDPLFKTNFDEMKLKFNL